MILYSPTEMFKQEKAPASSVFVFQQQLCRARARYSPMGENLIAKGAQTKGSCLWMNLGIKGEPWEWARSGKILNIELEWKKVSLSPSTPLNKAVPTTKAPEKDEEGLGWAPPMTGRSPNGGIDTKHSDIYSREEEAWWSWVLNCHSLQTVLASLVWAGHSSPTGLMGNGFLYTYIWDWQITHRFLWDSQKSSCVNYA